jgi:NAD(P) transhydrogenase subunit beta
VLAVVGTLLNPAIVTYQWIAIAAVAGILLGIPLARVPLTAVPERTGLSQAFGGLAALLVGTAKYYMWLDEGALTPFRTAVVAAEVILGGLTCTGGLMAAGKLAEWITTKPVTYAGQNVVSFLLLGAATTLGVWITIDPSQSWALPIIIALALIFGVLLILPIGGADMPTVISFLNSYAGL